MQPLKFKLIAFTIMFGMFVSTSFSQVLCKDVDEFNGKVNYVFDLNVGGYEGTKKGLGITLVVTEKSGKLSVNNCMVLSAGLECVDTGSELIIILENGEKVNLKSWNKFNCKANSYMSLSESSIAKLTESPISKMRFQNKRDYKTITVEDISVGGNDFFQLAFKELESYNLKGFDEIPICKGD